MNNTIGLLGGFAHCAGTTSYWVWIIVVIVLSALLILANDKFDLGDTGRIISIAAIVFALAFAVFFRPAEVGANTTKEQAARGVYIGY